MPNFDVDYDYTSAQNATQPPASVYVMPDVESSNDADAIEEEAAKYDFQPVPPGTYKFLVKKLIKPIEIVTPPKTGYVGDRPVSYSPALAGIILEVAGKPQYSIVDWFHLPPMNAQEAADFKVVTGKPNGTAGGFMSRKFEQFVDRIGFPFPKGGRIPQAAKNINNWFGREVYATVEAGKTDTSKVDKSTGMPYAPKPQVKPFSYRAVEGGANYSAPQATQGQQVQQQAAPARQAVNSVLSSL